MAQTKRADWVTCQGSNVVGTVLRVARDDSLADVSWPDLGHTRRMPTTSLEVQATIPLGGGWEVIDMTREAELSEEKR